MQQLSGSSGLAGTCATAALLLLPPLSAATRRREGLESGELKVMRGAGVGVVEELESELEAAEVEGGVWCDGDGVADGGAWRRDV